MKALALALTMVTSSLAAELQWSQLPPLPDKEGFAGCFAGVSNGRLIVAGGANISAKKWEKDFVKTWNDSVWVMHPDRGWEWKTKLPRRLGYGVSVSAISSVLCLGGSDETGHHKECFRMVWMPDRPKFIPLPDLPRPCANACGAVIGNTVYIAGGIETPTATKALHTFWALDLTKQDAPWQELEPWPGPERMLAVAAVHDGSFYLMSGASLKAGPDGKPERTFLRDAYRFTPGKGWAKLVDLPRPAVAAPSPAPVKDGRILVITGDDGLNVTFEPLEKHPGFPRDTLVFDPREGVWSTLPNAPFSRATVPVTEWQGQFVIPSGEVRPRVRTPEVWTLR